jgi:hypothetical protein
MKNKKGREKIEKNGRTDYMDGEGTKKRSK